MFTAARSLTVALALFQIATQARASEAGCTVIICLSNPEGYATLPACIFPVEDFVRSVGAGGGAPDCAGATTPMTIRRGRQASQRSIGSVSV